MNLVTRIASGLLTVALICTAELPGAWAADPPSTSSAPRAGAAPKTVIRSATLPARGLFEGDKLSPAAMRQIDQMLADAGDLDIEFAFVAPTGPWQTDGSSVGERSLTPERLRSLREHLARRGVDGKRVYVENRIDPKAAEARLDIELIGKPAPQ